MFYVDRSYKSNRSNKSNKSSGYYRSNVWG